MGLLSDPTGIGAVSTTVGKALDLIKGWFPGQVDPAKQLEMEQALVSVLAQGDAAQSAVNAVEAASTSKFIAGWRPTLGWICDIGIGVNFILNPLIAWVIVAFGYTAVPVIQLDTTQLITLITLLLGGTAARTVEKIIGVDTKSL